MDTDSPVSVEREIPFFFPDFNVNEWMEKEEPLFRNQPLEYDVVDGVHRLLLANASQDADAREAESEGNESAGSDEKCDEDETEESRNESSDIANEAHQHTNCTDSGAKHTTNS